MKRSKGRKMRTRARYRMPVEKLCSIVTSIEVRSVQDDIRLCIREGHGTATNPRTWD